MRCARCQRDATRGQETFDAQGLLVLVCRDCAPRLPRPAALGGG